MTDTIETQLPDKPNTSAAPPPKKRRKAKGKKDSVLTSIKKRGLTLAGAAILTTSVLASSPSEIGRELSESSLTRNLQALEAKNRLISLLKGRGKLSGPEEEEVLKLLSEYLNLKLNISLNGNRLNEIYGYIGAEQHLFRWAGDTLSKHTLITAGIAPKKGAFGDFDNETQEKYYVAVQLHEIPGWNDNWPTLKPFYRYRKVLVYNPKNGKAVVAVIGDSGPSKFTGKTFGGSPEVMDYLELEDGANKSRVIVVLVNDDENTVALGPVNEQNTLALK